MRWLKQEERWSGTNIKCFRVCPPNIILTLCITLFSTLLLCLRQFFSFLLLVMCSFLITIALCTFGWKKRFEKIEAAAAAVTRCMRDHVRWNKIKRFDENWKYNESGKGFRRGEQYTFSESNICERKIELVLRNRMWENIKKNVHTACHSERIKYWR